LYFLAATVLADPVDVHVAVTHIGDDHFYYFFITPEQSAAVHTQEKHKHNTRNKPI